MKRSVSVLIMREDGLVLGVPRKDNPNAWGLPGGKVDPGETDEQAAIRECKEETGLDCLNLIKVFEDVCKGEVDYWNVCFVAGYDPNQSLSTKENAIPAWITKKMLLDGPFGPYNEKLLNTLERYVQKIITENGH